MQPQFGMPIYARDQRMVDEQLAPRSNVNRIRSRQFNGQDRQQADKRGEYRLVHGWPFHFVFRRDVETE